MSKRMKNRGAAREKERELKKVDREKVKWEKVKDGKREYDAKRKGLGDRGNTRANEKEARGIERIREGIRRCCT